MDLILYFVYTYKNVTVSDMENKNSRKIPHQLNYILYLTEVHNVLYRQI